MTRNRVIFIGACLIIGTGVISIPLGQLAMATNRMYGDAAPVPGAIAVIVGLIFGIKALIGMHAEERE